MHNSSLPQTEGLQQIRSHFSDMIFQRKQLRSLLASIKSEIFYLIVAVYFTNEKIPVTVHSEITRLLKIFLD